VWRPNIGELIAGSNQLPEFVDGQASLSNDGAQGSFGDFTMVGQVRRRYGGSAWRSAI
jgi:hypothetical protein